MFRELTVGVGFYHLCAWLWKQCIKIFARYDNPEAPYLSLVIAVTVRTRRKYRSDSISKLGRAILAFRPNHGSSLAIINVCIYPPYLALYQRVKIESSTATLRKHLHLDHGLFSNIHHYHPKPDLSVRRSLSVSNRLSSQHQNLYVL